MHLGLFLHEKESITEKTCQKYRVLISSEVCSCWVFVSEGSDLGQESVTSRCRCLSTYIRRLSKPAQKMAHVERLTGWSTWQQSNHMICPGAFLAAKKPWNTACRLKCTCFHSVCVCVCVCIGWGVGGGWNYTPFTQIESRRALGGELPHHRISEN